MNAQIILEDLESISRIADEVWKEFNCYGADKNIIFNNLMDIQELVHSISKGVY